MRTSAPGSSGVARRGLRGFTLLELLVVVAVIAFATAGVSLALRDSAAQQLDREATRLAALLESARAQSRTSGSPVRWEPTSTGFRFSGLPAQALPDAWLDAGIEVVRPVVLVLGPEPIIGPQAVELRVAAQPQRSLRVATDGLRPFAVQAPEVP
jgi:general secretion pathway protein H